MRQRNKVPTQEDAEPEEEKLDHNQTKKSNQERVKLKFGPLGVKHEHKAWSRAILFTGVLIVTLVFKWRKSPEITWVSVKPVSIKGQSVTCSQSYLDEISQYSGCAVKRCGRFVMDEIITADDAETLKQIFKKGLQYGRSSGGASILDLHTGAVSKDERFINIYQVAPGLWSKEEFSVYNHVKDKVKNAVATNFEVDPSSLHLASPTFFSEMTGRPAKTIHDEYWHPHVDKETYETFHFTSLLYLSDYGADFQGGRFIFIDKDNFNRTVEPRKGRISMFTSGGENVHFVEKVSSGTRYALTIAFTCDSRQSIPDPEGH